MHIVMCGWDLVDTVRWVCVCAWPSQCRNSHENPHSMVWRWCVMSVVIVVAHEYANAEWR